jgi:hypothetical protein
MDRGEELTRRCRLAESAEARLAECGDERWNAHVFHNIEG